MIFWISKVVISKDDISNLNTSFFVVWVTRFSLRTQRSSLKSLWLPSTDCLTNIWYVVMYITHIGLLLQPHKLRCFGKHCGVFVTVHDTAWHSSVLYLHRSYFPRRQETGRWRICVHTPHTRGYVLCHPGPDWNGGFNRYKTENYAKRYVARKRRGFCMWIRPK